jgi:DNA-binding NtrC family response regulator
VSQLDAASQQRLSEWLAGPERRMQVISTSQCPLYPLVERNTLSAPLYYCLNVIMITLRELSPDNSR